MASRLKHGTHTNSPYTPAEKRSYADYLNGELTGDPNLPGLPMSTENDDLFDVISEGVVLCKLINKNFENQIDLSKLNRKPKNQYQQNENHERCLEAARAIKCTIVGIGAADLTNKNPTLVMGVVWQIIRRCLLVQIERNMDLSRLAEGGENLADVPPEQILLRWFNYHLKKALHHRVVANFGTDLQDGENYIALLHQLAPEKISAADLERGFREKDPLKRAEIVIEFAERLGCRKFVTAQDIVDGNEKLNLAFVATLFKAYPNLGPTAEEEAKKREREMEVKLEDVETLLAETMNDKESLQEKLDQTLMDFDKLTEELDSFKLDFDTVKHERDEALTQKKNLEEVLEGLQVQKSKVEEELKESKQKNDDLFAQLEMEISQKLDVEQMLKETRDELQRTKDQSQEQISSLSMQLQSEIDSKNQFASKLESALADFNVFKAKSERELKELEHKLEAESSLASNLKSELDETLARLEETQKLAAETANTKDELFKLLNDALGELETTKVQATEKELTAQLVAEIEAKMAVQKKLDLTLEEYNKYKAEWDAERQILLRRIKELEDEVAELKALMRKELDRAEREKDDALAKAAADRDRAVRQAEAERDSALDRMRALMSGNQKQGYMWKETETVLGTQWKRRYFVLRDNLLSWYKNDKALGDMKPQGMMYCEDARLYEMDEKDVKREFVFQIDNGKVKINVAVESLLEMKEWMNEIRMAKKKKIGTKAAASEDKKK